MVSLPRLAPLAARSAWWATTAMGTGALHLHAPSMGGPGLALAAEGLSLSRHGPPCGGGPFRSRGGALARMFDYSYCTCIGVAPSFDSAWLRLSVGCASVAPPALGGGFAFAGVACAGSAGSTWRLSGLCAPAGLVYSTPLSSQLALHLAFPQVCLSSTFMCDQGSFYAVPLALISNGFHLADYDSFRRRRRRVISGGGGSTRFLFHFFICLGSVMHRFQAGVFALGVHLLASCLIVDSVSQGLSIEPLALIRVCALSGWLMAISKCCGISSPSLGSVFGFGDCLARFGGFYGFAKPASGLIFWILLASRFTSSEAVCLSCNGNDPNCPGDNTCAMAVALATNAAVMAGGAAAANKVLDMGSNGKPILPLTWLQVLKPTVLDALVALARRKPLGTPTAIRDMSLSSLLDSLIAGTTPQSDARLELARRVTDSSTSTDDKAQIKLVCEVLPKAADDASQGGGGRLTGAGALQYVFALAMRIVRHLLDPSKISVAGGGSGPASSSSTAITLSSIELKRPKTVLEFHHSLVVWQSILSAVGLSSAVVLGPFLSDVVYLPMHDHGWEVALEHFLLYIQKVDSGCGWELASATSRGSQDTFLHRAIRLASPSVVKGGQSLPLKQGGDGPSKRGGTDAPLSKPSFNGKFNTDPSARPCAAFNTGAEHKRLRPDGTCPFGHTCDQWVSNKGPGGRCGSAAHARVNCDNPAKVASKVE